MRTVAVIVARASITACFRKSLDVTIYFQYWLAIRFLFAFPVRLLRLCSPALCGYRQSPNTLNGLFTFCTENVVTPCASERDSPKMWVFVCLLILLMSLIHRSTTTIRLETDVIDSGSYRLDIAVYLQYGLIVGLF